MADMRLIVAGAGGRMGRTLVKAIAETKGLVLAGAVEGAGSAVIGRDAGVLAGLGTNGISGRRRSGAAARQRRRLIDFTVPAATVAFAELTARQAGAHHRHHRAFERRDEKLIAEAAKKRRDREVRQHEPRRQSAGGADQARGEDAR